MYIQTAPLQCSYCDVLLPALHTPRLHHVPIPGGSYVKDEGCSGVGALPSSYMACNNYSLIPIKCPLFVSFVTCMTCIYDVPVLHAVRL